MEILRNSERIISHGMKKFNNHMHIMNNNSQCSDKKITYLMYIIVTIFTIYAIILRTWDALATQTYFAEVGSKRGTFLVVFSMTWVAYK